MWRTQIKNQGFDPQIVFEHALNTPYYRGGQIKLIFFCDLESFTIQLDSVTEG